jgi:type VI secretion system protein VasD
MKSAACCLAVLGVAAALLGCAGPQPAMPAPYSIVISADTNINPDHQNRAMPVEVRLYELKNSSNFESMDFYTLFNKDAQALGGDVLSKDQLMLLPGQRITLARKANPDARMLGVYVAFRSVEKSIWRAVAPLPQAKNFGRFRLFSPSFPPAVVTVKVNSYSVAATDTGTDVPKPIPGTGGMPQLNVPSVSAPAVSVPSISVPSVSVPSVSVPSVSVPSVSVPSVSVPSVTMPHVSPPSISLPSF